MTEIEKELLRLKNQVQALKTVLSSSTKLLQEVLIYLETTSEGSDAALARIQKDVSRLASTLSTIR